MPQFEIAHWPGQIFWLVITFGIFYLMMSKVFVPRIRSAVDARHERISGDMAEARRLRDEAEIQAEIARAQINEARAKAQRTAADAKDRAAADAAARQATLEAELHERLSAAETRIRASRGAAMGHVAEIAADTAGVLTQALSGLAVAPGEVEAASHALSESLSPPVAA
jgi:F-type H+-transporting ATPase subunit b